LVSELGYIFASFFVEVSFWEEEFFKHSFRYLSRRVVWIDVLHGRGHDRRHGFGAAWNGINRWASGKCEVHTSWIVLESGGAYILVGSRKYHIALCIAFGRLSLGLFPFLDVDAILG
jgi:hypothetical protein